MNLKSVIDTRSASYVQYLQDTAKKVYERRATVIDGGLRRLTLDEMEYHLMRWSTSLVEDQRYTYVMWRFRHYYEMQEEGL